MATNYLNNDSEKNGEEVAYELNPLLEKEYRTSFEVPEISNLEPGEEDALINAVYSPMGSEDKGGKIEIKDLDWNEYELVRIVSWGLGNAALDQNTHSHDEKSVWLEENNLVGYIESMIMGETVGKHFSESGLKLYKEEVLDDDWRSKIRWRYNDSKRKGYELITRFFDKKNAIFDEEHLLSIDTIGHDLAKGLTTEEMAHMIENPEELYIEAKKKKLSVL